MTGNERWVGMVRFPIRPVKENLWNWYCHPQMISLFFGLWPWSHKACIALNIVCSIYSIYMPTNHKFYSSICRVTANVSVLGDKLCFHALIQTVYLIRQLVSYFQKSLSFKRNYVKIISILFSPFGSTFLKGFCI